MDGTNEVDGLTGRSDRGESLRTGPFASVAGDASVGEDLDAGARVEQLPYCVWPVKALVGGRFSERAGGRQK
jgi:hypothetical protein